MILGYHPLCVCAQVLSLATPWTIAHQAPLSMEFYRQEYLMGILSHLCDYPPPNQKTKTVHHFSFFFKVCIYFLPPQVLVAPRHMGS